MAYPPFEHIEVPDWVPDGWTLGTYNGEGVPWMEWPGGHRLYFGGTAEKRGGGLKYEKEFAYRSTSNDPVRWTNSRTEVLEWLATDSVVAAAKTVVIDTETTKMTRPDCTCGHRAHDARCGKLCPCSEYEPFGGKLIK